MVYFGITDNYNRHYNNNINNNYYCPCSNIIIQRRGLFNLEPLCPVHQTLCQPFWPLPLGERLWVIIAIIIPSYRYVYTLRKSPFWLTSCCPADPRIICKYFIVCCLCSLVPFRSIYSLIEGIVCVRVCARSCVSVRVRRGRPYNSHKVNEAWLINILIAKKVNGVQARNSLGVWH